MEKNISIFGAGLVGALATLFLAKRGYSVHVYERRANPLLQEFQGGRSINLALSDRGWRALAHVGMDKQIAKIAIPMRGRMIHDTEGRLSFQPYGTPQQAIYSVSRSQLNRLLIAQAQNYENVSFHFQHKCLGIDLEKQEMQIAHKEQIQHLPFDLILGADGAFSVVRQALMREHRFNFSQHYIEYGYKELTMPPDAQGNYRLEKNALHIWPRASFMLIALPNLDKSFTCTLFMPFEGKNSFQQLQSGQEIRTFFEQNFADALPYFPNLENEFLSNPTSSLLTVRCSPWVHESKVALIGDAAHAIVPFYGQGMNAGFEDCFVLNQCLDLFRDDWEKALPFYQQERIPNTNAISELAMKNFVEMRDSVANEKFLLRKKIEAYMHQLYPQDWIPLYTMVTFSHIPYSEALKIGQKQDRIMNELMQQQGIEENWQSIDFAKVIDRLQMD